MDHKLDLHAIQVHTAIETTAHLKGILTVLTAMHLKTLPDGEKAEYVRAINKEMQEIRDGLREASIPRKS